MEKISEKVKKLLDKLYNLRSSDSSILSSLVIEKKNIDVQKAESLDRKNKLIERISILDNSEILLKDDGEKLQSVLDIIANADFSSVLNELDIKFDPKEIKNEVDEKLPKKLSLVKEEKKQAYNELNENEEKLSDFVTRLSEIDIRIDEAQANQDRLNHYFDLALESNLNITREEIASLLAVFDFNEEEQKEVAKVLMFPEDGLFEYDKAYKSGDFPKEEVSEIIIEPSENITLEEQKEEPIVINNEKSDEVKLPEVENVIPPVIEEKDNKESSEINQKEDLIKLLESLGFDYLDFTSGDFEKMMDHVDKETYTKNVDIINKNGIRKDIFVDNIELFYDKEVEQKIKMLLEAGKMPNDIYLNPSILVKYDLKELDGTIKMLLESGLDPKDVPLMAY